MPLISDETLKKIQAVLDKADEFLREHPEMGLTRTEALLCVNSVLSARQIEAIKDIADRIDEREEAQISAEYRIAASRKTMYENLKK